MKHKDCLYFNNGYCTFHNIPVDPEGQACQNFQPRAQHQYYYPMYVPYPVYTAPPPSQVPQPYSQQPMHMMYPARRRRRFRRRHRFRWGWFW